MHRPEKVLEMLKAGNSRFVSGTNLPRFDHEKRIEASGPQRPYAVVVGCSDSRVPVEAIFDAQMGELFVIRTAGHVLAAASFASLRYAIEILGARTVVVLGHDECGAVQAALEKQTPYWLNPITSHIRVSGESTLPEAVKAHVVETVAEVAEWAQDIGLEQIIGESVGIYGGAYAFESGEVRWL